MQTYSVFSPRILTSLFACLFLVSACAWHNEVTGAQNDSKEFQSRIQKYVEIQKKALSSVPAIGTEVTDAALISKREKQVADAIRALRPNAKQGDVFTPELQQMIRASVKQETSGKDGAAAKSTILDEGNPKSPGSATPVTLAVQAPYPTAAPLSTVPPSVLMALPTLPKDLEFRFVGRDLILRDAQANMIVDFVQNVL